MKRKHKENMGGFAIGFLSCILSSEKNTIQAMTFQQNLNKITLILLAFCTLQMGLAQERMVKMTNELTQKEITIKENRRVKVKTTDGQKINGRVKILGDQTIVVNNRKIELSEIQEMKKDPLLVSIFSGAVLIYAGVLAIGMGAIIGVFVQSSGFLLAIPGTALIYAGTNPPNFSRRYKNDGQWRIEIINP